MWTRPAGALSTCNISYLLLATTRACKLCYPSPSSALGGATVQYLVGDGDAREGGVARQVETWRGYKNQDGTSRQIFIQDRSFVF